MTQHTTRRAPGWPAIAALVAAAAGLGFGAAQWRAARQAPATAPVAASAAAARDPVERDPVERDPVERAPVAVSIPAQYLASAGIVVEAVGARGLQGDILTAGTVVAPPNREAVVLARASGNVTKVLRQLGDSVRAGDVLAQVESADAAAMAAERSVTLARVDLARKNYAREASLFKQGVTARQEMEAAQSALAVAESEAQRAAAVAKAANVSRDGRSVAVQSPIGGKVSASMLTLGAYVQPQTELFRVAGEGPVQVEVALPAADAGRVARGDKATVIAAGGAKVEATVRSVTSTVSGATRSATVVLEPAAGARALIVGAGVEARLHVRGAAPGMVVPEDAVQNVEGHDVLFVRTRDGFVAQPVLVGERSAGLAQIVSGVKPGQQVATRNAFLIKADMIKSAEAE